MTDRGIASPRKHDSGVEQYYLRMAYDVQSYEVVLVTPILISCPVHPHCPMWKLIPRMLLFRPGSVLLVSYFLTMLHFHDMFKFPTPNEKRKKKDRKRLTGFHVEYSRYKIRKGKRREAKNAVVDDWDNSFTARPRSRRQSFVPAPTLPAGLLGSAGSRSRAC